MDSQFHMAGEASQSWQKAKEEQSHVLHGGRQERSAGKRPFIKPSNLMRLIHCHENSTGKTCPHDSVTSHQVLPTTHGNSRGDLGGGHSQTVSMIKDLYPKGLVKKAPINNFFKWQKK